MKKYYRFFLRILLLQVLLMLSLTSQCFRDFRCHKKIFYNPGILKARTARKGQNRTESARIQLPAVAGEKVSFRIFRQEMWSCLLYRPPATGLFRSVARLQYRQRPF